MKRLGLVFAIAACGGGAKTGTSPESPEAPSECAVVAGHLADMAFSSNNPPQVARDELVQLVRERCETDQWTAESKACFGKVADKDGAKACIEMLTKEQQAAMEQQLEAKFGSRKKPAAAAPPPPESAPARSADPCEGGE